MSRLHNSSSFQEKGVGVFRVRGTLLLRPDLSKVLNAMYIKLCWKVRSSSPQITRESYIERLVVGPTSTSPTAKRVAGGYTWPPPDKVVAALFMITKTSQLTSPNQERPPVLAGIRGQRGVLLAAAHYYGITQPPGLLSPSLKGRYIRQICGKTRVKGAPTRPQSLVRLMETIINKKERKKIHLGVVECTALLIQIGLLYQKGKREELSVREGVKGGGEEGWEGRREGLEGLGGENESRKEIEGGKKKGNRKEMLNNEKNKDLDRRWCRLKSSLQ